MFQMLQQPRYKKKDSLVQSNRTATLNEFTNTMLFPSIGTEFPSILWSGQKNDDNSVRNDVGFYHNPVCTNVIQGAFDDNATKEYNDEDVYRVLLKIIEKHEDIDEIKKKVSAKDIHKFYDSILYGSKSFRSKTVYTERQIAEQLIRGELGRDMISIFLDKKRVHSLPQGSNILPNIMRECWYFHATERDNVETIFSHGLNPWRGGKGNGISTKGIAKTVMQDQYNKWSNGWTFITADFKEAAEYKDKLENGVILDIFVGPALRQHLYIDPDSKGIKCDQPIYAVGDGKKLNPTAVGFLSVLAEKSEQSVTEEEIQKEYGQLCHSRT